jgi:beta-lactam-binding protein with PASTA domain
LRKLLKYFFLSLVLLLVFLSSALLAMRFAIQGREVRVPKLTGLNPLEAERVANTNGLVLSVESRFYNSHVPQGRIVSQAPEQGATVRRGWKIRVAESLGPQRAAVPNLIGQSQHAAEINISRRGLETGTIGYVHLPGVAPGTVIAQSPAAEATEVASPRVNLILSAAENGQRYIMPSFVGKPLSEAATAIEKAGFTFGKIHSITTSGSASTSASGMVIHQFPQAGQSISAGASISFEVSK